MTTARARYLVVVTFFVSGSAAKCGGPPLITPNTAGIRLVPARTLQATPKTVDPDVGRTKGGLWLEADKNSVRVVFAFNNPCGYPIAAGFRRRSDVIDIGFFDPTPRTDPLKPPYEGLICPASFNIMTFEATVPQVPAGQYTVNVFGIPDTTSWKPQFAEAHGRVVVPRTR
jgi:hypothetical protein